MAADDLSDAAVYRRICDELVEAVQAALGPWVLSSIERCAGTRAPDLAAAADDAAVRCEREVGDAVAALVAQDIDEQRTTPLAILRAASRYPAEVLAAAGVAAPVRDPFDERANPDDRYAVGPETWADLGPAVADAGIAWGAAKAHRHLRRRRGDAVGPAGQAYTPTEPMGEDTL